MEKSFILFIRNFDFLRIKTDYKITSFSYTREPSIEYHNYITKQTINIYWSEDNYQNLEIKISKKFLFSIKSFHIKEIYKFFNCNFLVDTSLMSENLILQKNSEFIQEHLMPIIKGEIWIDELLKQKEIK